MIQRLSRRQWFAAIFAAVSGWMAHRHRQSPQEHTPPCQAHSPAACFPYTADACPIQEGLRIVTTFVHDRQCQLVAIQERTVSYSRDAGGKLIRRRIAS
jgi:hypothetical protein